MNNIEMEKEKKPRKLPVILNFEEQRALLAQPNPKAPTGLRNLCMIKLMLDAGLRLSEVISLRPQDIDFENSSIEIHGEDEQKDVRSRTLWLGQDTLELIKRWLEIKPNSEYLFSTLKGGRLDDRYIREMVKRLAGRAKIKKNVFPHSLRHSFAADLYRKTRNIRIVQEALGHADLSTTMIYTFFIDENLEKAMQFFRSGKTA